MLGEDDRLRINIEEGIMYNDRKSGSQIVNIIVELDLTKGVQVEFGKSLEISLDCFLCVATRRTIQICENEEYGICIKTKHQFPIKILSKAIESERNIAKVSYQIEYWYSPFFDLKYKKTHNFYQLGEE